MIHPMTPEDALFWSLRPIEAERARLRRLSRLPSSGLHAPDDNLAPAGTPQTPASRGVFWRNV